MILQRKRLVFFAALLILPLLVPAAIFNSVQSGDWADTNTWAESGTPTTTDDIVIHDGHTVSISGSAYTHSGNITIYENGELIAAAGNSSNGFTFDGPEFHVFGKLTIDTSPSRDLKVTGNSLFWGHPSAIIFVSDDWIVAGNSKTVIDGICVEVDDDFHVDGTSASLCGSGGVSIGNNNSTNTFNKLNGATEDQICLSTTVYRGVGGSCTTTVADGTGNGEPTAVDDSKNTQKNVATTVDVLDLGVADNDPDPGQELLIYSVGNDPKMSDGQTAEGGTVSINNNGTVSDPTDDFVDYQPAFDFIGTDYFYYVITDQKGAFTAAEVMLEITAPLPISLMEFSAKEKECEVILNWSTASEENNAYFEVEKSRDGRTFLPLAKINGAGNTATFKSYSFVDPLPEQDNYYRLKQTDYDGQFTYSEVIFLGSKCIEHDNIGVVSLFPNPAMGNMVHLRFNARSKEDSPLLISDVFGQVLQRRILTIDSGMNDVAFDVQDFPAGTYFIHLGKQTVRLVRVRD